MVTEKSCDLSEQKQNNKKGQKEQRSGTILISSDEQYQINTNRKDESRLHFNYEPRVQQRQQVQEQQSYLSVFVALLLFPSNSPGMITVFYARSYGDLQRQGATSGKTNFVKRIKVQRQSQQQRQCKSSNLIQKRKTVLKDVLKVDFSSRTNPSTVIRLFKQNNLSFSSTEINKPNSASQARFKFRSQLWLLSQIRSFITLRVESSIITTDSNITDNTIRMFTNTQQEKCRTKNKPLRNTSINWIYLTKNYIRPNFLKKVSISKSVKSLRYVKSNSSSSPSPIKRPDILSDTYVRGSAVD